MESMFKKRDRMLVYAYALGVFLHREPEGELGICYDLIDFLQKELGYYTENFFFSNSKYEFPELWRERTNDKGDTYFEWFNNKEERIQALRNILKIK